jgi:hypothetical protein
MRFCDRPEAAIGFIQKLEARDGMCRRVLARQRIHASRVHGVLHVILGEEAAAKRIADLEGL